MIIADKIFSTPQKKERKPELVSCCVVLLLKDEAGDGKPAVRDDPSLQEQVQAWLKQNQFQNILQQGIPAYILSAFPCNVDPCGDPVIWFVLGICSVS